MFKKKSKGGLILVSDDRAKKPYLTLNLSNNGLKVTSESPVTEQAG